MRRPSAPLLVAATVVLWAVAFPAIRVALETTSPVSLSFWRLAIASGALLIAARARHARLPDRRDVPQIALCGATGMAAYQLLLNIGERSVPAGTASLIVATAPVYSLIIASRLLAERIPRRRWFGLSIAMVGSCAVAVSAGGTLSLSGAALAVLAAAVVQGLYHAAQRPLLRSYSALEVATYAMVAGAAMLLPTLPWAMQSGIHTSARSWAAIAFLALGPSALGFVTWAAAVAELQVSRPALALYAVPVLAIVVAWVWLDERPRLVTVCAGCVALVGVAVGTWRSSPPPNEGVATTVQSAGVSNI